MRGAWKKEMRDIRPGSVIRVISQERGKKNEENDERKFQPIITRYSIET